MISGLEQRVAIVMGASKGIGKAIAKQLSLEGTKTIIVARDPKTLQDTAAEIGKDTDAPIIPFSGDVTDTELPKQLVNFAIDKWGKIDILINNAGGPPPKTFLEADDADWLDALQLNLLSTIRMSRAIAPSMKAQNWGRIITIGSTIMKEPSPQMVLSATARAGMTAFSKAISFELAPFGITVNSIATGGVQTDRLETLFQSIADKNGQNVDELINNAAESIPIGRFASPEEFARMILFLCSDGGQYVTGQCIAIDGGLMKSAF